MKPPITCGTLAPAVLPFMKAKPGKIKVLAPISSTRTAATIESSHIATNCTNQRTGVATMLLKPSTMGGRLFDGGMLRDYSDERDHFEADMNWVLQSGEQGLGLMVQN